MYIKEKHIKEHLLPFSRDERNLNRYVRFINTLSSIEPRGNVKHHILPRSMFPEFAKSSENIISLTEREHYIAHLLLWKAVGGKMTYAFSYMSHQVKNSRKYADLSREFSRVHSERMTGENNPLFGVPLSKERREAISKRMTGENNPMFGVVGPNHHSYGVPLSKERREAISKRFTGSGNHLYGKYGEEHPKFGHAHSEETRRRQSDGIKMFYVDNPDARHALCARQKETWKSEELRQKARDAKIGEKNPSFGKDITNSLSKEVNMLREQRAKEGVRKWNKENPSWDRIEKDSPKWILWSLAPQIIESKKGSTALSRDLVGDKKYFNTILRIKQLAEEGWVPNEDERWVGVFGNDTNPLVEETTSLDSFT